MNIFEDTRQQKNKHDYTNFCLEQMGHTVIRNKLYVGDYTAVGNNLVAIDTKQNYLELAGNICGKQHNRFRKECQKAQALGIKLIVLVEENCPPSAWKSPANKAGQPLCNVAPETLAKAMATMTAKYGVQFEYCDKKDTAARIVALLGGGNAR